MTKCQQPLKQTNAQPNSLHSVQQKQQKQKPALENSCHSSAYKFQKDSYKNKASSECYEGDRPTQCNEDEAQTPSPTDCGDKCDTKSLPKQQKDKEDEERKKQLRRSLAFQVQSWIAKSPSLETISHYLDVTEGLMTLIGYPGFKTEMLETLMLPSIVYGDRYVTQCGLLSEPKKAFLLLLVAALITIKMWHDKGFNWGMVAETTGMSKNQLANLEKEFIRGIDYNFFISTQEMDEFKAIASQCQGQE